MAKSSTNRGRGRPKGALNKATREIKDWGEHFFGSPGWRAECERRMLEGKADSLTIHLLNMTYGKPRESVEIDDKRTIPGAIAFIIRQATDADSHD